MDPAWWSVAGVRLVAGDRNRGCVDPAWWRGTGARWVVAGDRNRGCVDPAWWVVGLFVWRWRVGGLSGWWFRNA